MIDVSAVVAILSIYAVGVIIPGPNFIAVTHAAVASSRRHALGLVAGIVTINIFWAASALLGLGAVFELFPRLALGLRWAGAAFLILFGLRMWRRAGPLSPRAGGELEAGSTPWRSFLRGAGVNLANPKSVVFYAGAFSAAAPSNPNLPTLLAMLAVVASLASLWYGCVAVVLSRPVFAERFARGKRHFDGACGALLVGLGVKQAFAAAR